MTSLRAVPSRRTTGRRRRRSPPRPAAALDRGRAVRARRDPALRPGALRLVIEEALKPEDFYREPPPAHLRGDARALRARASRSTRSRSPSTCAARASSRTAGGQAAVDALAAAVPAVGNAAPLRARSSASTRCCAGCSTPTYEIQRSVLDHDGQPRDIVELAERGDPRGRPRRPQQGLPPGRRGPRTTRSTSWQSSRARGISLTGTPSGFTDLDEITGGFQPGNLIIIAARPSMGKSALVTNIAENVALRQDNRGRSRCSRLEMSRGRAGAALHRLARRRSRATTCARAASRDDKWKRVLRAAGDYEHAPLYVDDSSDIGLLDIRAKARRLHQQLADRAASG